MNFLRTNGLKEMGYADGKNVALPLDGTIRRASGAQPS
jgi:hypothetical protein